MAEFKQLLEHYKWQLGESTLSANTQRAYLSRLKQYLAFIARQRASGGTNIGSMLRESLPAYCGYMAESLGLQPRSINSSLTAIDHFFRCIGLESAGSPREPIWFQDQPILTEEELRRFLGVAIGCGDARNKALALLLSLSDTRVGECSRLNTADVIESGVMLFVGVTSAHEQAAKRQPLHPLAALALREWLSARQKLDCAQHSNALFVSRNGNRLSTRGIDYVIRRLGWSARLDICPETLRRTYLKSYGNRFDLWPRTATVSGGYQGAGS